MQIRPLVVFLALALAQPPAQAAENLVRYEASHECMGTVFTVAAYGRDQDFLAEVVNEVFDEFDRIDAQMSNYKPESELSQINREAAQRAVIVEPRFFRLLQDTLQLSRETDGAFDPTVGPLMKHWGFFRGHGRLPSKAEIAEVLKRVGYRHVKLDAEHRTIRFDESGIELDLGGNAKGYAVDRGVDILRSSGITSALVSSGTSSIYALGAPPGAKGWKVTIRDPYDARKAGDTILLRNFSVSTSGSYEKFFKIGGKTYCHIVDPHTGWPVENMLCTVAIAATGSATDGLSTALFVMGPEASRKYLASHPDIAAIFYQPSGPPGHYARVVLRSNSYRLPADALAEIEP
jgi:thiamine biosynthesis lipoprotein